MSAGDKSMPAFPGIVLASPGEYAYASPGMTLRDYFASQVLSRMSMLMDGPIRDWTERHARICYAMADAMLVERDRKI